MFVFKKDCKLFSGKKVHYLSVWVQIVTDPLHIWLLKGSEQAWGGFQYVRIWVSLKGKTAVSQSFVTDFLYASPFL